MIYGNPHLEESEELQSFVDFCALLKTQQGKPLVIEEFQKAMLADHAQGVTESVAITPKKNGKTSLIAALALYHTLITANADVIIIASTVRQAQQLYTHCRKYIRASSELQSHFDVKPGFVEIRNAHDLGRIRVFAAHEAHLEGVEPTLAVVEEYQAHTGPSLYQILNDGLDTRGGQMICITNAGSDERSPLGKLRAKAHKFPIKHKDGAYLYTTNEERSVAFHEWALEPEEDRTDMAVVKKANPASWMTTDMLQRRYDSPAMTPQRWARMACGVWAGAEGSVISAELFSARAISKGIPAMTQVLLGADLAWSKDSTALTPLQWKGEEERIIGTPVVLETPSGDALLDDRAIWTALRVLSGEPFDRARFIRDLSRDNDSEMVNMWCRAIEDWARPYQVVGVVFDPNSGGRQLAQQYERKHGTPFITFDQRPTALARASSDFLVAMNSGALTFVDDRLLRQHMLSAVEIPLAGGDRWYFGRSSHGARKNIDALTAAVFAHSVALAEGGLPGPKRQPSKRLVFH